MQSVKQNIVRNILNVAALAFFMVPVYLLASGVIDYAITGVRALNSAKTSDDIKDAKVSSQTVHPFSEPVVSITFDDGWKSVATTAAPLMAKYNVASTQYVITGLVGQSGYMNVDNLKALKAAGHEIGSHSVNHIALKGVAADTLIAEFNSSKEFLAGHGLIQTEASFAFPYGSYDQAALQAGAGSYAALRNSDGGPLGGITEHDINVKRLYNPSAITGYGITNTTTLSEVREVLALAKAKNGWLVLLFHQIDDTHSEYSVTPALIEQIIKVIKDEQIKTATIHNAVAAIKEAK